MEILNFITSHWEYIVSAAVSVVFLVVNIIQALRCHDKNKLNDALCRIPEIIRNVEVLFGKREQEQVPPLLQGAIHADLWSIGKKATAESIIESMYGSAFVKKHIKIIDDAIEDILNTPQKKGESNDGLSKENEER